MAVDERQDGKQVPVFRKRGPGLEQLHRRAKRVKLQRQAAERAGRVKITSNQAAFVAELCRNGGNVAAAARAIGVKPDTARAWLRKPSVGGLYSTFLDRVGHEVQDWGSLLGRAQQTLLALLDSPDERVRADIAKYLTERAIGKVPTKVEATIREERALSEVELQAALSLVAEYRMTMTEASRYVRDHPDEVAQWASDQVLRRAEPQEATVLAPGTTISSEVGKDEGVG